MKTLRPALLSIAFLAGTAANAADLQISVTAANGRAAPDVVVMVVPAGAPPAAAAATVDIVQKDNRFEPYVTAIPAGTTVRFVNQDRYDHHTRSLGSGPLGAVPPAKSFEVRLAGVQAGGGKNVATVTFETPGAVTLGCHIHGSMRGHLFITPTPFVAVTDEFGRATLRGLPDGAAEVRLWHPDQITGQATQTLQLAGSATAKAALSFTPQRRPQPRPKSDYD
jgi:plastocyanin